MQVHMLCQKGSVIAECGEGKNWLECTLANSIRRDSWKKLNSNEVG
jgi:hypothetical protein